ncbi:MULTISPECIES: SIS domain-containing protein [unclassified Nonomuraea]|uniref:SIS domain-containing protein n=1 Tax=unclassified Nonomuraea TaxID=2593643 RepID=UPI0033CA75A1
MAIEPGTPDRLLELAAERRTAPGEALARDAGRIVRAAGDMAERFRRGGRLITFGDGAAAADAGHVAVEFTHPVIVGKRALPAISLAGDAAALGGLASSGGPDEVFAAQVRTFGRPGDIALGVPVGERDRRVLAGLAAARELGMLTVALTTTSSASPPGDTDRPLCDEDVPLGGVVVVDHVIAARCGDPLIAREVHVTAYHLLWELVHVLLDDPGLAPPGPPAPDATEDTPGGSTGDSTRGTTGGIACGSTGDGARDTAGTCVTCADTAVPVHVTELRPGGLALVETGCGTEEVSVALVEARVGDVVLVHAKEAIVVLGGDGS